jgi:hypothetical protein
LGKSANSWGTKTKKTVNSYFAIKKVTAPTNGSFSKTIDINMPDSPANRLMPIIGEMAKRANSLGWEASESIHVYPYGKSNLCKHISSTATNYYNFSHNHVYRICLGNSSSYNKFILLHEAGHAISDMNNGPLTTDYSGDSKKGAGTGWIQDPYNFCKNDIAKYQEKSHSYYTREFLGAAACEGFADFFAVAVLNNRNPDNNNNYLATMNTVTSWPNPDSIKKRQYSFPFISNPFLPDWERIPGEAEKLPEGTNISIGINSTTPEFSNWTNKYCKPPVSFQHLTTESDWINFFWSIYAAPDAVRFSISEIATIWHEAKTSSSKAYCLPFNVDPKSSYKNPWTCKTVFFQAYPPGTPDYCYSPYGGYEESYECQLKPAAKRTIGKTWNDLQKYVEKKYGKNSPKATLFKQYGLKTGVTFY